MSRHHLITSVTVAAASLLALSGCAGGAATLSVQPVSGLKVPAWARAESVPGLKVPGWARAESAPGLKVPAWARAESAPGLKVPGWARAGSAPGLKVPGWARAESTTRNPSAVTLLRGSLASPDVHQASSSSSAMAWSDWTQ